MEKELIDVDISVSFDNLHILEDIKFTVHENEFLVVVGPSGCGKTVMADCIASLIKPSVGKVMINKQTIDPKVQNISFVFQEPSCIPFRTVSQDVSLGLEIKGADDETIRKRVKQVLELVGLDGYEDYFPKQLSGGMKQRVAIARAYATDPDFLIMDEPFGHLDAQTRYLMQIEIMRVWEKEKKTVVFITNNIEEAVYVASRVIVLSKRPARIKQKYKIDLPRPRNLTTPEFLKIRKEITKNCEVVE